MKALVIVNALVLASIVACGSSDRGPPASAQDVASAQAERALANMQSAEREAEERRERQQNEVLAAAQADALAQIQASDERSLADAARHASDEIETMKACDDTRGDRHRRAVAALKERLDLVALVRRHATEIRRACRLTSRVPGALDISSSSGSMRVRPVQDDVRCAPLPAGVSKQNAWVLLTEDQTGESSTTGSVLRADEEGPLATELRVCRQSDVGAGLDVFGVTYEDATTFDRVKHWAPKG